MTPQELKNSILQLAIQGKLVEQRAEEGTAAELVEKILATKNAKGAKKDLTRSRGARGEKKTSALSASPREKIPDDEKPFDIPESWEWVRLEGIINSIPSKQYQILESEVRPSGEFPVISQSKEYSIGFTDKSEKVYHHVNPVIVFGDHTAEVKFVEFDFVVGADGIKIFEPLDGIVIAKFLFYVLQFHSSDLSKVGGYSRHYKFLKDKPIPLPPLAEQKRIVAKIEELLPLIDRYEKAWSKLEDFNKRFPVDMQKSLLQMAIQGKLVDQRPEEGTGEELYRQIQLEKQRLIKSGKIKKEKPLPEITDDEIPFDVPDSWKWVRLGQLGNTNIGLTYGPKDVCEEGVVVLRSSNIQNGKMDYADIVKVSCSIPESKMCHVGDILICARNGSKRLVGKAALIDREGMSFGAFMAIFRSSCNAYVLYVINSAYFRNALLGDTGTTTINQITQDMMKNMLIPLPPLAEQKRIVAKLEEILPLCERLR